MENEGIPYCSWIRQNVFSAECVSLTFSLTGKFRIWHSKSETFLSAGSSSWEGLKFGFEFSDTGDLFQAESSNAEWTRVMAKTRTTPSLFGLHSLSK
jgi:hypothetical protein